jgi:hypothetical protein
MSLFAPATIALLHSGCALLVGTVTPDGEPVATRGWGCTLLDVESTPARLRLLLGIDDASGIAHVERGSAVAITGTSVRTLHSVQMKGHVVEIAPESPADEQVCHQYTEDFYAAVADTDGTPRALLDHLTPTGLVAWTVEIDELFDQTPGPGAGSAVGSPP